MALRHQRDEEALADAMKATRKAAREANRPTGTETALTKDTVEGMAVDVETAKEQAQQAIDDAADALTTSSGKNARRRGENEPEPPPGGWVQGDQWIVDNSDGNPVEVRVWDGDEFVFEQLLAAELLVVSGGGVVRLADGVVTADAIAADAIDGMIITGATIRTAASGQRLEMTSRGLVAYDETGTEVAELQGGNGGVTIGSPSSGDYAVLRDDEMLLVEDGKSYPAAILGRETLQLTDGVVNGEYRLQLARKKGYVERVDRVTDPSNVGIDSVDYNVELGEAQLYVRKQLPGAGGAIAMAMMHAYAPSGGGDPVSEVTAGIGSFESVQADVVEADSLQPRGSDFALPVTRDLTVTAGRDASIVADDDLLLQGDEVAIVGSKIALNGPLEVQGNRFGLIDAGTITAQSELWITGLTGALRYEITLILTGPTSTNLSSRLVLGDATNAAAQYDRITLVGSGTTAAAGNSMAQSMWTGLVNGERLQKTVRITLMNLNSVEPTFADVVTNSWDATTNPNIVNLGLRHRAQAAFDGLYLLATGGGGTMTGRYEVRAL